MTRAVLFAILDTLLPGDEGEPPLPRASEAALDLTLLERLAQPVIAALGDADDFVGSAQAARVARLRAAEQAVPEAFRALLTEALAAYYEAAPVLAALDWRNAPPQPHGHALDDSDPAVLRKLDRLRSRAKLWRG